MNPPGTLPQAAEWLDYPAVVVHGRAQAEQVLSHGVKVALLSSVGAASLGGPGWWRAMVEQARAAHPETPCLDILDCADAPGFAMAALRIGQRRLILWPCPAFAAVQSAALGIGATVHTLRPPAFDVTPLGLTNSHARHRLAEYLCPESRAEPTGS